MTADTHSCTDARDWLAAHRDNEAGPDDDASTHLEACHDCQTWVATFDQVSRQVRLRAPTPTAALTASIARIATEHPPEPSAIRGRRLLIAAAVTGIAVLALSAAGLLGHTHLGSTEGRQAEALSLSLIGGYALAAWRPARLAAGLLPVAAFAAAITVALSILEVSSGAVPIADELAHLPLVLGAAGAAIATRETSPATTVRPREYRVTAPRAV
jgi:predicted anti-sigma-YlaC factor YlaD